MPRTVSSRVHGVGVAHDRDLVPEPPAVAVGEAFPTRVPRPVGEPRRGRPLDDRGVVEDLRGSVGGSTREAGEEVLGPPVAVDAAEPGESVDGARRRGRRAGSSRRRRRGAASRARPCARTTIRNIPARGRRVGAVERLEERPHQADDEERQDDRDDRQGRPRPLPEDVLQDEREEPHAVTCRRRRSTAAASPMEPAASFARDVLLEDPLVEVDEPVGAGGGLRVVGHHDDRLPELVG